MFVDKKYRLMLWCAISFFLIWLIGFWYFASSVFKENFKSNPVIVKDGIIVLTGGRNRVAKGAELFNNNLGGRLLISGVQDDVTLDMIEKSEKTSFNNKDRVDLGHKARDTVGNAKEVESWIKKNNYHSVYVVTSFYHVPRSRLELERFVPDVNFEFVAVNSSFVREKWWLHRRSTSFLLREWAKFLFVFIQYKVLRL